MIETLKRITAETVASFTELTRMGRMTSGPENFLVTYSAGAQTEEDPFPIDEEVRFMPVFFRNLEDTTLFAEMVIVFTNLSNGSLSADMSCSFKTNPDGVDYYEPCAYADMPIGTPKKLHVSDYIEAERATAPETIGNIVALFENAIIDFMTENSAIFTAKTNAEFEKKSETETEDSDVPF